MALTLAESAKLSQDNLHRGVLETFVQESPILDRIPFMQIEGNAYAYNEEATLPGVAFRKVNEAYTESTGTVNQKTETLYILGGDADVDRFIVQTRGNLNDQRAVQTALKTKALSYEFQGRVLQRRPRHQRTGVRRPEEPPDRQPGHHRRRKRPERTRQRRRRRARVPRQARRTARRRARHQRHQRRDLRPTPRS